MLLTSALVLLRAVAYVNKADCSFAEKGPLQPQSSACLLLLLEGGARCS